MYEIQLSTEASDFLRQQSKKVTRQIVRKLESLAKEPRPANCVRLKGNSSYYRIRSGDYRIVYTIRDKQVLVLVLKIGHRKDVYKRLD
jgi:mRNA interferase RelE/StbE